MTCASPRELPDPAPRIVRQVASRCRRFAPPSLTPEDLRQIGGLAAWVSHYKWSEMQPAHAEAYLAQRVRGAIFDEIRRAHGPRGFSVEFPGDQDDAPALAAGDDPEGDAIVAEAAAAVDRLPHPLPLIADRLARGFSGAEVADELGVSGSAVSQRLAVLRRAMARFLPSIDHGRRA